MDAFIQLIKASTLEAGGCSPTIFIEGAEGTVVACLSATADSTEERARTMFLAGTDLSKRKRVGKLRQVCLVNEAWLGLPHEGKFIRPSEDPKRIEVLLFDILDVNENKQTLEVLKMVRNPEGKLTDLWTVQMPKGVEVQSYLLPAFVAGYTSISTVSS